MVDSWWIRGLPLPSRPKSKPALELCLPPPPGLSVVSSVNEKPSKEGFPRDMHLAPFNSCYSGPPSWPLHAFEILRTSRNFLHQKTIPPPRKKSKEKIYRISFPPNVKWIQPSVRNSEWYKPVQDKGERLAFNFSLQQLITVCSLLVFLGPKTSFFHLHGKQMQLVQGPFGVSFSLSKQRVSRG